MGRSFVKQFPDVSERLCRVLNANEVWLYNFLIPFVCTNSGVLKAPGGVVIDRPALVSLAAEYMSQPTVYRTVAGLLAKGVLARCYVQDEQLYVMNPYVCHRGSRANATLLTLFQNTEWAKGARK